MIGRLFAVTLLVVTAVAVQTAALPFLAVAGFRPDLLLLVVIAFSVHDGAEAGVRIGFVAGLLTDLLLQTSAIGVGALSFTVVGYAVGWARPYLAPNSLTAPLLLAFGGSVLGSVLLGSLSAILGDADGDARLLFTASVFVGVVNTLLIPFLLRLTRAVSSRFPAEGTAVTR